MWGSIAFVDLLLARLAYVVWVGYTLKMQDKEQRYTTRYGVEGAFLRFRTISNWLMLWDSAAFIALNLLTIDTMHLPVPRLLLATAGVVIALIGLGVKVWATRTLGPQSYHWHNFFVPKVPTRPNPPGPYKYLSNPMYGVGYLQTYGLALLCSSWYGLIASGFMQLSIYAFNDLVETPHYLALLRTGEHKAPRDGLASV
ncbi:MAG TPA: methyltransferase [Gemmatimonadaceae bacterium]|nr:methyltransferase [Gemmatimonadaceae bacterium]